MTRRIGSRIAVLLALTMCLTQPVTAAGQRGQFGSESPLQALQRRSISLDEAVAMVQSRYDAKVVKAETIEQRGRLVHRIRLLSADGRVWTVNVDAASGDIR